LKRRFYNLIKTVWKKYKIKMESRLSPVKKNVFMTLYQSKTPKIVFDKYFLITKEIRYVDKN